MPPFIFRGRRRDGVVAAATPTSECCGAAERTAGCRQEKALKIVVTALNMRRRMRKDGDD